MDYNNIILFDGVCNFCNSSINFVIERDPNKKFKFAPLQSEAGEKIQKQFNLDTTKFDSVLLIKNGKVLSKSTAALYIAKELKGLWPLLFVFIIVPPFLRNAVYNYIAKNRYKWFGKQDSCMMPTPDLRSRFLVS
ncbi:MAG: thiol-disulfide oxidoreductase DCC family protein [Bacteroidota bacterium]